MLNASASPLLCRSAKAVPPNSSATAPRASMDFGSPHLDSSDSIPLHPKPKSFSEAVAYTGNPINASVRFSLSNSNEAVDSGKVTGVAPLSFSISPNPEMLDEISKEKNRLRNFSIFFSAVEVDKCPPRKFLDDWFHNYWNLKLGYHISFCRQIQKGLFIIFFNKHEAQTEVLKRQYWSVGSTSFRALAWSPEAIHEEVLALSAPRWILVKQLPPFLWRFLPQMLEPLGKVIRMDDSVQLVPHMDARILISLNPGLEIPSVINICILEDNFSCPIEILGGAKRLFPL